MYFSSVVRFEDLASNPRQSLQDLMKRMDLFVTQSGLNYIETHTLRDRFKEVGKTSCNKILTKTEALVLVSFSQTLLNEIRQAVAFTLVTRNRSPIKPLSKILTCPYTTLTNQLLMDNMGINDE